MKKWNVLSEFDSSRSIIEQILEGRNIKGQEAIATFLNPLLFSEFLKDTPEELKNSLNAAKKLILSAIKKGQKIVIYGDYDADGICATAILYSTIKYELNYDNVFYFIPNRFEHGYGMSVRSLEEIIKDQKLTPPDLFITVDTGITALVETDYIKKLGYQVIITDHHQKSKELPNADCIVWNDAVVGSTISWFLSKVLGSKSSGNIALAALATVTDLQPLLGINRSIVKKGLEVINNNPPVGIKKLLDVSGRRNGEVSTYELGWVLGPRLNASGRLVEAYDSLNLLLENDPVKASEYAQKLNTLNEQRQDKTTEMYEIAMTADKEKLPKIIFSSNETFHEGIIGLVASKLTQRYFRPSIVIARNDGVGKGSARSIPGINIIKLLRRYEEYFVNLGGHPMAAGFTINLEKVDELAKRVNADADRELSDEDFIPILNIDLGIPIEIVDINLILELEKLKPFGLGNEEPVFMSKDLGITDVSTFGKESNHLLIKLYRNSKTYKAVFFGGVEKNLNLNLGDKVDLAFTVKRNDYNGKTYVDLVVKDIRLLT